MHQAYTMCVLQVQLSIEKIEKRAAEAQGLRQVETN